MNKKIFIHDTGEEVYLLEDKKAAIFNCAKELFSSKGFKDTNVSDITKMAEIGVGTFYNYYPSKEKLFIDIFMEENEKLKKSLTESFDPNDNPVTSVVKLVMQNFNATNSNPILKEWYNKDVFSKMERYFYEQGGVDSIHELLNSGQTELIKEWKAEGKIRNDLDEDLINAIFTAIPYIDLHKSEIGIHHFPQILYYITEFIMKGLTDCPKKE
jgi:AcrR family transcriptional regulator